MVKRAVSLCLLGLLVFGCATQQPKVFEGKEYGVTKGGFHGRWWNYYERGASYLAGGFYDEAVLDFEQALRGRSADTWQARTYGLHFVEYFPNRELGVAYYHLNDLDTAESYLKGSLSDVDTDRAHYYVALVTRKRIAMGELEDAMEPVIEAAVKLDSAVTMAKLAVPPPTPKPEAPAPEKVEIPEPAPAPAAPPPPEEVKAPEPIPAPPEEVAEVPAPPVPVPVKKGVLVAERSLPIEVKASDDVGVYSVEVNGREMPQRGSAEEVVFEDELLLSEGTHEIELVASDLADKKVTETVEVTVDLTGPTIGLFAPADPTVTENQETLLEGVSMDANGVVIVALGDRILAESHGTNRLDFDTSLPLGRGENSFVVMAKDTAGNETRSSVKVFRGKPDSIEARLWLLKQKAPHLLAYAANGFPELMMGLQVSLDAVEQESVLVNLKSPDPGRPYRHNRTLRVSGDIVAQTKVASLSINGEEFTPLAGAPKESFNKRIPIDMEDSEDGARTMTLTIAAVDAEGHEARQEFEVDVRPIHMNSRDSKMP
ncbi:MAG TPA: hypothetical protein ENN80_07110, partial [Candidatus Hydrogenedentes bacterium]|nr:hypothetical protein [Candidatus Hydrogenedentota bacterium]